MTTLGELIADARAQAYAGNADAATTYMFRLPNSDRGYAVEDAYKAQIPTAAFREILYAAWDHDHTEVWRAANRKSDKLREWFRAAEFDVSHLPDMVTLWRGGVCFRDSDDYWETPLSLTWGPAWSLRRDVACWFATTWQVAESRLNGFPNAYPCVIKITVSRRYCLAHLTGRSEDEIIAFTRRLRAHRIDGSDVRACDVAQFNWRPSDQQTQEWRSVSARYESAKK
jgi:hypothetical protein